MSIVLVVTPCCGGQDVDHVQVGNALDSSPSTIGTYLKAIGSLRFGVAKRFVQGAGKLPVSQRDHSSVVDLDVVEEGLEIVCYAHGVSLGCWPSVGRSCFALAAHPASYFSRTVVPGFARPCLAVTNFPLMALR